MRQSWLLRYSLLVVAATTEALTHNYDAESNEVATSVLGQSPRVEVVVHEVIEQISGPGSSNDGIIDPTNTTAEGEAPALRIPTATPSSSLQRRQDDGQVQALSDQLQSLSQSATEAISSVSSSASSVSSSLAQSAQSIRQSADQARQSADQAIQSANQEADQANRQLSQTESSASSEMSQMSSSMSSRLSSVQSSASDAVSSARSAASQFAASQIQAARATAGIITDNPESPVEPDTPSFILSTTNFAIIIAASVVGTAVLSTVFTCLIVRCRYKKKAARSDQGEDGEKAPENSESSYDRPVAVRGTLRGIPSPRFPRFGRATVDDFKLPSLSPLLQSMREQRDTRDNFGTTLSGYTNLDDSTLSDQEAGNTKLAQPAPFRLQKDDVVGSATTVRLIRVNSAEKNQATASRDNLQTTPEPTPPVPMITIPYQSLRPTTESTEILPSTQTSMQNEAVIAEPPKSKQPPWEQRRYESPVYDESRDEERRTSSPLRRSASVTGAFGQTFGRRPTEQPYEDDEPRYGEQRVSPPLTRSSSVTETLSRRPSARLTASPDRFKFRDSSDLESNTSSMPNTPNVTSPGVSSRPSVRKPRPPYAQSQSTPNTTDTDSPTYSDRPSLQTPRPAYGPGQSTPSTSVARSPSVINSSSKRPNPHMSTGYETDIGKLCRTPSGKPKNGQGTFAGFPRIRPDLMRASTTTSTMKPRNYPVRATSALSLRTRNNPVPVRESTSAMSLRTRSNPLRDSTMPRSNDPNRGSSLMNRGRPYLDRPSLDERRGAREESRRPPRASFS
ncbi:hypothetical protein F4808DRAFT_462491 [Astrocystis sublimbata]|nr:hypothetical protein F4808DRAFT_462491 [Astrocystis sublimbata]